MDTRLPPNKLPFKAKLVAGGLSAVFVYYCAPLIKSIFTGTTYEVGAGLRDPGAAQRLKLLVDRTLERDREISQLELQEATQNEAMALQSLEEALAVYEEAKNSKALRVKKFEDLPPVPTQATIAQAAAAVANSGKPKQ